MSVVDVHFVHAAIRIPSTGNLSRSQSPLNPGCSQVAGGMRQWVPSVQALAAIALLKNMHARKWKRLESRIVYSSLTTCIHETRIDTSKMQFGAVAYAEPSVS